MASPILYSFRRCPFAIRARLALAAAGLRPGAGLELREVHLARQAPRTAGGLPQGHRAGAGCCRPPPERAVQAQRR